MDVEIPDVFGASPVPYFAGHAVHPHHRTSRSQRAVRLCFHRTLIQGGVERDHFVEQFLQGRIAEDFVRMGQTVDRHERRTGIGGKEPLSAGSGFRPADTADFRNLTIDRIDGEFTPEREIKIRGNVADKFQRIGVTELFVVFAESAQQP